MPQPPKPPRPTLVCRHRTVILVISTTKFLRKNSIPFNTRHLTLHEFLHRIFFFTKHNLPLNHSGKVDGMVSNLQHYPYVTITNKTPYDTHKFGPPFTWLGFGYVQYDGAFCSMDIIDDVIASGDAWTASSRGLCLVEIISVLVALPGLPDGLECAPYESGWGTAHSMFSIFMKGDDACCVLSSHQTPQECP